MTNPEVSSVALIGMPGAGKSTVGVLLAKIMGLGFVDTDLDIQRSAGATLQEILEDEGYLALRELEEKVLLDVPIEGAVISTGGSVVYSTPAMTRLAAAGPVVYLRADIDTLAARVSANPLRGIASDPASSFEQVYAERTPLYEQAADLVVDVSAGSPEELALAISRRLAAAD
jgi:shikimate kinase